MPKGRLVKQQEARPRQQRATDRQHLLLAARERAAALVDALLQARKQREHLLDVLREPAALVRDRTHLQVFPDGHPREDPAALG